MIADIRQTLTARERMVLALVMDGSTSKVAGEALGVSPRTVEFHRSNIMHKLSAKNVAQLMQIVLREDRSTASA